MKPYLIIGTNGHVLAIDTATGEEAWRTKLRDGFFGGSRGSDVSVLVEDDIIYAGCGGRLYALSFTDGSIKWSNELKGLGFHEISLSKNGTSVQFITRTVDNISHTSSSHT